VPAAYDSLLRPGGPYSVPSHMQTQAAARVDETNRPPSGASPLMMQAQVYEASVIQGTNLIKGLGIATISFLCSSSASAGASDIPARETDGRVGATRPIYVPANIAHRSKSDAGAATRSVAGRFGSAAATTATTACHFGVARGGKPTIGRRFPHRTANARRQRNGRVFGRPSFYRTRAGRVTAKSSTSAACRSATRSRSSARASSATGASRSSSSAAGASAATGRRTTGFCSIAHVLRPFIRRL
jgi:hypothetical protein